MNLLLLTLGGLACAVAGAYLEAKFGSAVKTDVAALRAELASFASSITGAVKTDASKVTTDVQEAAAEVKKL